MILFMVSAVLIGLGVNFVVVIADNSMKVNTYTQTTAIVDYAKERNTSSYTSREIRAVSSRNNVTAHYEVDGTAYSIHITGFGVNENNLQQGDSITVYYDPANPSQAIVKASAGFVFLNVFFIVLCSVLAIVLIKKGIKLNIPDKDDYGSFSA